MANLRRTGLDPDDLVYEVIATPVHHPLLEPEVTLMLSMTKKMVWERPLVGCFPGEFKQKGRG